MNRSNFRFALYPRDAENSFFEKKSASCKLTQKMKTCDCFWKWFYIKLHEKSESFLSRLAPTRSQKAKGLMKVKISQIHVFLRRAAVFREKILIGPGNAVVHVKSLSLIFRHSHFSKRKSIFSDKICLVHGASYRINNIYNAL